MLENYPYIKAAVLEMAYDNGLIYRDRTECDALLDAEAVMGAEGVCTVDIQVLEAWMGTLTTDERSTLVTGEHLDMEALEASAPKTAEGHSVAMLFTDIFEGGAAC